MKRRDFLHASLATGAALSSASGLYASVDKPRPFQLKYAPHFGMFRHHAGKDLVAQLQFMADQGFTALEDNGMLGRPVEDQNRISRTMDQLGMEMGVFVATKSFGKPTFASGKKEYREPMLADMRQSVEVAKRLRANWVTVVPGNIDHRLPLDYQTSNVIENLKYAAEVCEPSGLVMVLEPLNHYTDHPELFLHLIPQAFLICRAVDSPSCKILFDIYHQQISEGNLIPNMEHAWDEIAYFQVGDNPGRKEPGTGEINYRNVFHYIHGKGFNGIVGMEHGNSKPGKAGELAVIEAYRDADAF
jgi:hydroxypyruvate isomerase